MNNCKWFLEVVQDFDGTYYANMVMGGQRVSGLPENVDYMTLSDAIRQQTGVSILKRKDMLFEKSGRKKYAYIDNTQERKDCRVTLAEMKSGWNPKFDSEPTKSDERKPTAVDDLLHHDKSFRYQLLDRMRSDCEYYLGYGNRHSKHLWAGDEKEQIACMKALWESFPADEKNHFLSFEKILDYEQKMVASKPPLSALISNASTKASHSQTHFENKEIFTKPER